MRNMNSGYTGYSMSNRAVLAYDSGEKPLSKWTKAILIDEANNNLDINIKSLKKSFKNYLNQSSWHHTSKFCNVTYFYEIDYDKIEQDIKDGLIVLYTAEELKEIEEQIKLENAKKELELKIEEEVKNNRDLSFWKEIEKSGTFSGRLAKDGRTILSIEYDLDLETRFGLKNNQARLCIDRFAKEHGYKYHYLELKTRA